MISTISASAPGNARAVQLLRQQIACRIWWSIFSLDRVVSICLGRPMAVNEEDCACELPLDLEDDPLQQWCHEQGQIQAQQAEQGRHPLPPAPPPPEIPASTLTGFLAFAKLSHIAGRIQQLGSARRFAASSRRYRERVAKLDTALRRWLENLPDAIRFSANAVERKSDDERDDFRGTGVEGTGQPGLVMCVIIFMVHAGSLLNLYQ
jgi:hypothetical protein